MTVSLADIENQARMLSPDERARLAEVLLESIQNGPLSEIEAAWQLEIENRVAAYERGENQTFPAEEVFAEVIFYNEAKFGLGSRFASAVEEAAARAI